MLSRLKDERIGTNGGRVEDSSEWFRSASFHRACKGENERRPAARSRGRESTSVGQSDRTIERQTVPVAASTTPPAAAFNRCIAKFTRSARCKLITSHFVSATRPPIRWRWRLFPKSNRRSNSIAFWKGLRVHAASARHTDATRR